MKDESFIKNEFGRLYILTFVLITILFYFIFIQLVFALFSNIRFLVYLQDYRPTV